MRARLLFLAFLVVFFTANVAFQIFGRVYAAEFHVTNATGLQNALTTAQSNGQDDVIYLVAGVYSAVENGKGFVYDSTNGDNFKLTICGENGTTPDQVILDGDNAFAPVLSLVDENPDHLNSAFTVQGITIRNGKMQEWDQNGGGLCVSSKGDVTVKSCIITANTGDDGGGVAIWSDYGWVTFINNIVTNNVAMDDGGGVDIGANSIVFKQNTIKGNKATEDGGGARTESKSIFSENNTIIQNEALDGGGIWIDGDEVTLKNNTINDNIANDDDGAARICAETVKFMSNVIIGNSANGSSGTGYGGASAIYASEIHFENNVIAANKASSYAGGLYISCDSATFVNNTLTENETAGNGGGLFLSASINAHLYNNIIWGNTGAEGKDIYIEDSAPVYAYNNDIHSVFGTFTQASSNIDADPLFVDPAAHDYHLSANSPCIDKGNNSAPELPSTDFEGDPRIIGGTVDIGADEYRNPAKPMPWLHLLLGE